MGADDDARLAGLRIEQRLPLGLGAQRPGEQRDPGGDVRTAPSSPAWPSGPSSARNDRACCAASTSVGASIAACLPASTACSIARSATTVLPAPTSPCTSRFIGCRPARSAAISSPTACCPAVSANGSRASNAASRRAGRGAGTPRRAGRPWPGAAARARAARPSPRPTPAGGGRRRCRSGSRARGCGAARGSSSARLSRSRTEDGSGSAIVVDHVEHLAHRPGDHLGTELAGGRVDGDEGADLVVFVEGLELRVGELQLPVEHADLAGEHGPDPRLDQRLQLVAVEERAVELGALLVADHDGEQLAVARAHVAQRGLLHLRDDRDVLADLQARDVGEPPAVDVAARVVAEQVADRVQGQLGGQQLGGTRAQRRDQWRGQLGHSTPNTSG